MKPQYRLTRAAQADIRNLLVWSERHFGLAARQRYQLLLSTALRDVASDPCRAGSQSRPELGTDIRSWHLRLSRHHIPSPTEAVHSPRHTLLYVSGTSPLVILRVVHDAMEPALIRSNAEHQ